MIGTYFNGSLPIKIIPFQLIVDLLGLVLTVDVNSSRSIGFLNVLTVRLHTVFLLLSVYIDFIRDAVVSSKLNRRLPSPPLEEGEVQ